MAGSHTTKKSNGKSLTGQASVNSAIKSICDIMRRSNCAGALQYVPELTWILFLRILDERETNEADEAEALGLTFTVAGRTVSLARLGRARLTVPRRQEVEFV